METHQVQHAILHGLKTWMNHGRSCHLALDQVPRIDWSQGIPTWSVQYSEQAWHSYLFPGIHLRGQAMTNVLRMADLQTMLEHH